MITEFKIFEGKTDLDMINDMFSRCDNKQYMKYISEEDPDLFVVNDKFDEFEAKKYFLKDVYNIEVVDVEEQKLVSFYEFTNEINKIIGHNPVLLYHYTSSNLLNSILKNGLITGYKKTNPFSNTYSGVYLTTENSGRVVEGYVRMAVRKHGGMGIQLYVKKYLNDVHPDPDDADLRSGKFQFITEKVFSKEILFHEEHLA